MYIILCIFHLIHVYTILTLILSLFIFLYNVHSSSISYTFNRGVKAVEYGVVGDVLFWSLRTLLGSAYTNKIHNGWTRIFSAMLAIIVPVAVAFELESYKQQGLAGGPLNSIGGVGGGKKDPNLRSASEPPTGYHKPLMRQQTAHFKTKLSVQEALYLRNVQKSYHSISSNSRTTSEAGTETQHSQASTKEEA